MASVARSLAPVTHADGDYAEQRQDLRQGHGRTTISLTDPRNLRGTTSCVLLEGLGQRLRRHAGGLAGKALINEYDKSFEVAELDSFLSHSWHASWWQKYFALLFHYNGAAATATGIMVGVLSRILFDLEIVPAVGPLTKVECRRPERLPYAIVALPLGLLAFVCVLFSWHRLLGCRCCKQQRLFFDAVCIHQTDPELKSQGIMSIGAILGNSDHILVAWDSTYFERLWCTYELSAFRFARPGARIVVLPVAIGAIALSMFLANVLAMVLRATLYAHRTEHRRWTNFGSLLIALQLLAPMVRQHLRDCQQLKQQLEAFSVRNALCFCCEKHHVCPNTGRDMVCDREIVYDSIAYWHGNGDRERGLDNFDLMVRGSFAYELKRSSGGWWQIPYRHAVASAVPAFLYAVDYSMRCNFLPSMLVAFDVLFLRVPLVMAALLGLGWLWSTPTSSWLSERLINLLLGLSIALLSWAYNYLCYLPADVTVTSSSRGFRGSIWEMLPMESHGRLICSLWILFQVFLLLVIYRRSVVDALSWRSIKRRAEKTFARTTSRSPLERPSLAGSTERGIELQSCQQEASRHSEKFVQG
eukprot:TRINITY_DN13127_c0_g1_i1.p1 TRINITY_DN13127_c0_g1~~TRINITY_DN13127_c0_g1_i1.p1  ORF type:complete len:586 (-),score=68.52 TRINITY_DN13127_c0_g1_i1:460-2217(-)